MPLGTELFSGEFRWAVLGGIAIVQSALTHEEALVLAEALNKQIHGFRQWRGLEAVSDKQIIFNFAHAA